MPKVSVKADTILTELKRQIAIGNFARGSALPSQYELAKLFQVSHMTVRKAIAGLTAEGYLRCMPRVGFFVNDTVSEKKMQRQVGLILPAFATPEFVDFIVHMQRMCDEKKLLLRQAFARHWDDRTVDETIACCDGIIAWSPEDFAKLSPVFLQKLQQSGKPLILIGIHETGRGFDSVVGNTGSEIQLLVENLVRLGHHNIGLAAQIQQMEDDKNHYYSWRKTLQNYPECSHDFDRLALLLDVPLYQSTQHAIYRQLRAMKGNYPFSVLIVKPADYLSAVAAVTDDGFSVPDDLSLAVIGDRIEMQYYRPAVSYVNVSLEAHAREALALLLRRWENPDMPPQEILIPSCYVPGDSVKSLGLC